CNSRVVCRLRTIAAESVRERHARHCPCNRPTRRDDLLPATPAAATFPQGRPKASDDAAATTPPSPRLPMMSTPLPPGCFHACLTSRAARLPRRAAFVSRLTVKSLQPLLSARVARHAPVAARRQTHRADLRPVRQTRALELVREEARQEHSQPLANFFR